MAELDLAAFLRARYDEAENGGKPDRHTADCGYTQIEFVSDECTCGVPEFVLADVAAKRQIVAMHKHTATRAGDRLIEHCTCQDDWSTIFGRYWPCDTLSLLALPYAGHPDYREDFRP